MGKKLSFSYKDRRELVFECHKAALKPKGEVHAAMGTVFVASAAYYYYAFMSSTIYYYSALLGLNIFIAGILATKLIRIFPERCLFATEISLLPSRNIVEISNLAGE